MIVKKALGSAAFGEDSMEKVNLFETARFFCDVYCLRPGQQQKVHTHAENDKVYYVLRGRLRVTVGRDDRDLSVDEMALAAAGEPHGIANDSDQDAVCLVFMAPHPRAGG